jgi:hypothetical protein
MSISLDGYVAGPDQSSENPVGLGGLTLHEWHWHAGEAGHEADIGPRRDPRARLMELVHSPYATHIRYLLGDGVTASGGASEVSP